MTIISTFPITKAENQHQAGLFALAKCVPSSIQVQYGPTGQPQLNGGFVSIAHTGGMAVGAYSTSPIGIDIETVSRKIPPNMCDYFLSEHEQSIFPGDSHIYAWTIKEACLKLRGAGITEPPKDKVQITKKHKNNFRCEDSEGELHVNTILRSDYIIAIAHDRPNQAITIH